MVLFFAGHMSAKLFAQLTMWTTQQKVFNGFDCGFTTCTLIIICDLLYSTFNKHFPKRSPQNCFLVLTIIFILYTKENIWFNFHKGKVSTYFAVSPKWNLLPVYCVLNTSRYPHHFWKWHQELIYQHINIFVIFNSQMTSYPNKFYNHICRQGI